MHPRTYDEVYSLLEAGQISVAQAFKFLRELEFRVSPPVEEREKPVVPNSTAQPLQVVNLEDVLRELEALIGLGRIKRLVKELQAFIHIQKRREAERLNTEPLVLHMIFKGNPGTGKTTVARLLGKIFRIMGVLPKGHLIEVERADLVGEYIGHTAQKTREQIKRALGGILFIDEAYSLARGGEKDFGKEAIDALVKAMEDHKDNLIVVLAGYRTEMDDFIKTNPGLKSRFPIIFDFEDYSIDELLKIAQHMLDRRQYRLSKESEARLAVILSRRHYRDKENFGNARLVRNLIERGIRKQAVRLYEKSSSTRDELMLILPDDLIEEED